MNINEELEQMIKDSGILFDSDSFSKLMTRRINEIMTSLAKEGSILFVGTKEDVSFMEQTVTEHMLCCKVLDGKSDIGKEAEGFDKVIAVSPEDLIFAENLKKEVYFLEDRLQKYGFVMVYGEKGVHSKQKLSEYQPHPYEEFRIFLIELDGEDNLLRKAEILNHLIDISLRIRDFMNVDLYLEKYIRLALGDQEIYRQFQQKLAEFLKKVERCLLERKHKDVILFWLDALEQGELEHTDFLKEYSKDSLLFERAYSFTPFTSASTKIIFDKCRQIEEKGYDNENFKSSTSSLYKCIKKNGYDFMYDGLKGIADKLDIPAFESEEDFDPSMIRIWNAMDYLLNQNSPAFVIIHQLTETHMPWFSPLGSKPLIWASAYSSCGDIQREKRQRNDALQYIDGQLRFYSKFFDYPCTKIVFSDHGSERDIRYNERNLNTILFIKSPDIASGICRRIFSAYNFRELMEFVFSPTEEHFERMFTKDNIAYFQDVDVYNELAVNYYLEHSQKQLGIAFRGAVGEKDKYILMGDKTEIYYVLPDEETNLIGSEQYSERIAQLRNLVGDEFIDIYQVEKFSNSRKLYQ